MVTAKKDGILTQGILHLIFIMLSFIIIMPFFLVLAISFSNEKDIVMYGYQFIPKRIDLSAYNYIFKNSTSILKAYNVTTFSTVVGTSLSVLLMSMIAYPISKKRDRKSVV